MSESVVSVGEALAVVRSGLDALRAVAPWRLSAAELAEVVAQAETCGRRLAGVQLAVIAEIRFLRSLSVPTHGHLPHSPGRDPYDPSLWVHQTT